MEQLYILTPNNPTNYNKYDNTALQYSHNVGQYGKYSGHIGHCYL